MSQLPDIPSDEEINQKLKEVEDKLEFKPLTFKELIKNHKINDIPLIHQHNLEELLSRVKSIEQLYGKKLSVTSGYRSLQEHLKIYSLKGITDQSKIPMKSRHLTGSACDIYDPVGELKSWINNNVKALEDINLYCEDFAHTPNWIHFQVGPPLSGKRFLNLKNIFHKSGSRSQV